MSDFHHTLLEQRTVQTPHGRGDRIATDDEDAPALLTLVAHVELARAAIELAEDRSLDALVPIEFRTDSTLR